MEHQLVLQETKGEKGLATTDTEFTSFVPVCVQRETLSPPEEGKGQTLAFD